MVPVRIINIGSMDVTVSVRSVKKSDHFSIYSENITTKDSYHV